MELTVAQLRLLLDSESSDTRLIVGAVGEQTWVLQGNSPASGWN